MIFQYVPEYPDARVTLKVHVDPEIVQLPSPSFELFEAYRPMMTEVPDTDGEVVADSVTVAVDL